MHFDSDDLKQLTSDYLNKLSKERIIEITEQMRNDLAEARDRLNQNPSNSSKPTSACAPWEDSSTSNKSSKKDKGSDDNADDDISNNKKNDDQSDNSDDQSGKPKNPGDQSDEPKKEKRKPGKQKGAKGFGRTQKLTVTHTEIHRPCTCKGCQASLDKSLPFSATEAHYTIDIVRPKKGEIGLQGTYTKHTYGSVTCSCGFNNKTSPNKVDSDKDWKVDLGEKRLIGPMLLAFMVFLKMQMHMTTRKIKEFLEIWVGISLSTGCINTAIREAGRSVFYLNEELLELVKASGILHVDET